jgi:hypothetical protein
MGPGHFARLDLRLVEQDQRGLDLRDVRSAGAGRDMRGVRHSGLLEFLDASQELGLERHVTPKSHSKSGVAFSRLSQTPEDYDVTFATVEEALPVGDVRQNEALRHDAGERELSADPGPERDAIYATGAVAELVSFREKSRRAEARHHRKRDTEFAASQARDGFEIEIDKPVEEYARIRAADARAKAEAGRLAIALRLALSRDFSAEESIAVAQAARHPRM